MSLITRCPACDTLFKVVSDQLRISDGWVRCGQCSEVFDASLHLQADAAVPAPAPHRAPAVPPPAQPSRPSQFESFASVGLLKRSSDDVSPGLPKGAVPASLPAPAPLVSSVPSGGLSAPPAAHAPPNGKPVTSSPRFSADDRADGDADADKVYPQLDDEDEDLKARRAVRWDFPSSQIEHPAESVPAEDELAEVPFVRQAQQETSWRSRRGKAWPLLVVAALLGLALMTQAALHERHLLAARFPALRDVLQVLCRPLGCAIEPLRAIDAIVIDSSVFARLAPDRYRLAVVIKNTGAVEVAMPSLEVTLTDSLDKALIRRVVSPQEFGAGSAAIEPSGEFSSAFTMHVPASSAMGGSLPSAPGSSQVATHPTLPPAAESLPIVGYRVLAFYP